MWILFLEAGCAFFLFIFIVWWTMFHGRNDPPENHTESHQDDKSEK